MMLAQKPGARAPIVLVIDIDQFKTVNDSFGLSIGDSALLAVARRLSRDMKPGDTLARLAGDQFGAIILDESHSTDLAAKIDRLRKALAAPISFGIGIGLADQPGQLRKRIACRLPRVVPCRGIAAAVIAEIVISHRTELRLRR